MHTTKLTGPQPPITTPCSPEARAASHLSRNPKASGAGVPVQHVEPAVGGDGQLEVVQTVFQGHPVRSTREQAYRVRGVLGTLENVEPPQLQGLALLSDPQQNATCHHVRRHQVRAPKQRTQQACDTRLLVVRKKNFLFCLNQGFTGDCICTDS